MTTNTIIGISAVALAISMLSGLVYWSRRAINRIHERGPDSARRILHEMSEDRHDDYHAEKRGLDREKIQCKTISAENVEKAILAASKEFDLLVIGTTLKGRLRQMTHVPVPESIARQCEIPLAMVRASAGLRGWLRRYI